MDWSSEWVSVVYKHKKKSEEWKVYKRIYNGIVVILSKLDINICFSS